MLFNFEEEPNETFNLISYESFNYNFDNIFEPFPTLRRHIESFNLNELNSNNDNFMQEKNVKYSLYPLYINWKKIEIKSDNNVYFNIFKLFGYFGEAIFNILKETTKLDNYYNHKNFLKELNSFYIKYKIKYQIEKKEFIEKLINIYEDVISLIKNKIMIFKEITVFIIIMRLYEIYFLKSKNKKKVLEILKYQYIILSYLKEEEYKKIYHRYFKKLNYLIEEEDEDEDDEELFYFSKYICKFPKCKKDYINYIRNIFKKINKDNIIKIKEENE